MEDNNGLLLAVDVHGKSREHCEGSKRDFVKRFGMNRDGRLLGPGGALYGPRLFL